MSIKKEWQNHQNEFLDLVLAEIMAFESKLRPEIGRLIAEARPVKKSLRERICLQALKHRNRDLYDWKVKPDQERAVLLSDFQDILGDLSDRASYAQQLSQLKKIMQQDIDSGASISPFLPDLNSLVHDQLKIDRLLPLFAPSVFEGIGVTMAQVVMDSKPGDNVKPALAAMLATAIIKHAGLSAFDKFKGFNEENAFAALETLYIAAGGIDVLIPVGTRCTHAGVLDQAQTLSDDLPCFTTVDPNKIMNYGGWAVDQYEQNQKLIDELNLKPGDEPDPKLLYLPQIISGLVTTQLKCAVMKGTSFKGFKRLYCDDKPGKLKEWIKVWAECRFDALSATNGGDDELLIIKPASHFTVDSSTPLPLTKDDFNLIYNGHAYVASKPPTSPTSSLTP
jgi:hypothetical protein